MYPPERRPAVITAQLQAARITRAVAQRAAARGSDGRLLVQPLQRLRAARARCAGCVPDYEREAIRPHALGTLPRPAAAPPRATPRCSSTSTTGSARAPTSCCRGGPNAGRRMGLNENYARELHGAAHARRGRRLHPAGRDRGRARLHRLDHRPAAQGGGFVFRPAGARPRAPSACSGTVIPAGGGEQDGERVLDILVAAPVDGALHRDQARPPLRERRPAAGAGRARRPRPSARPDGDIRAVLRDDLHLAGVLVARRPTAPRSRRRSSSWPARCGRSTARIAAGAAPRAAASRWRARSASSASRSTRRSRPPAIPTAPRPG